MKTSITRSLKTLTLTTVAAGALLGTVHGATQDPDEPLREYLESLLPDIVPDTPVVQRVEEFFDGSEPEITTWATAWGDPSGNQVVPGFGLVLELLHGDSDEPRLRLSGGMPGHGAAILLADESDGELDPYGTWRLDDQEGLVGAVDRGANMLLPDEASVFAQGSFDWRGTFEVPWPEQPEGTSFWLQGVETGGYFATGSGSTQMSHALEVQRGEQVTDHTNKPRLPAPLPPSLPVQGARRAVELFMDWDEIGDVALPGLDGVLARALVYEGDALTLTVKVAGSATIKVVAVGVAGGVSFSIKRVAGNRFVVSMAESSAVSAGAKLYKDLGGKAQFDVKETKEFRFHSIQGLGRGLRSLTLGDHTSFEKGDCINVVNDLLLAREEASKALSKLAPAIDKARRAVATLKNKASTKVGKKVYGPALSKARKALAVLEERRDAARAKVQAIRDEMAQYAAQIRTAALIGQALVQGPMFLQDHLFAIECDFGLTGALSLGLPTPYETGTNGASVSLQATGYIPKLITRIERMTEPRGIAYTETYRYDGQAQGFVGNGRHAVQATIVPSLQFVNRIQLPVGEAVEAAIFRDMTELRDTVLDDMNWKTSTEIGLDVEIVGRKGGIGYAELGVGKAWQVTLSETRSLGEYVDAVKGFLDSGEVVELLSPLGSMSAGYSAQARRTRGFGAKVGIDAGAAAFGLDEASAKWIDPGRKFDVDLTAAEAVEKIQAAVQGVKDRLGQETTAE